MPTSTLRRVGGSVMVAVPPGYLARTGLGADKVVSWEIEGNSLIMRPQGGRPRYTLAELLDQCDRSRPRPRSDRPWTAGGPKGRELI